VGAIERRQRRQARQRTKLADIRFRDRQKPKAGKTPKLGELRSNLIRSDIRIGFLELPLLIQPLTSQVQTPEVAQLKELPRQLRQPKLAKVEEASPPFLLFRDAGAGDGQAFRVRGHIGLREEVREPRHQHGIRWYHPPPRPIPFARPSIGPLTPVALTAAAP